MCVLLLFIKAPKDPLRGGLGAALAGRLVRQTNQDGLKWDLLKQVLRVRAPLSGLAWLGLARFGLVWGCAGGVSLSLTCLLSFRGVMRHRLDRAGWPSTIRRRTEGSPLSCNSPTSQSYSIGTVRATRFRHPRCLERCVVCVCFPHRPRHRAKSAKLPRRRQQRLEVSKSGWNRVGMEREKEKALV